MPRKPQFSEEVDDDFGEDDAKVEACQKKADAELSRYRDTAATVDAALKIVLDAHEKYVAGEEGGVCLVVPPCTNLSQAVLKGVILRSSDLRGADLSGSATDPNTVPPNGLRRMSKREYFR